MLTFFFKNLTVKKKKWKKKKKQEYPENLYMIPNSFNDTDCCIGISKVSSMLTLTVVLGFLHFRQLNTSLAFSSLTVFSVNFHIWGHSFLKLKKYYTPGEILPCPQKKLYTVVLSPITIYVLYRSHTCTADSCLGYTDLFKLVIAELKELTALSNNWSFDQNQRD